MTKAKAKQSSTTQVEAAPRALDPAAVQARLAQLAAAAQLTDLDTVHVNAERLYSDRMEGPLAIPESTDVEQQFTVRYAHQPSVTGFSVLVSVEAKWKSAEGVVYAVASTTVRLAYAFRDLTAPPERAVLEAFANDLGVHHAWPFLRERLRSLSSELNVPVLVLPLRRPPRP